MKVKPPGPRAEALDRVRSISHTMRTDARVQALQMQPPPVVRLTMFGEGGDAMTANESLKQMNDRYALFQTLWNMYFVVSFGVLAFMVSAKFHDSTRLWSAKAVAILAYLSFAYSNLGGLRRVRNEHDLLGVVFLRLARQEGVAEPELVDEAIGLARYRQLPAEWLLIMTYVIACLLVCLLILLVPLAATKS
jgi:hypothetical protein